MATKKYVALASVDYLDKAGKRQFAKPATAKHNGVFTAEFDERQEARLLDRGAIRLATKKDVAGNGTADAEPAPAPEPTPDAFTYENSADGWVVKRGEAVVSAEPFKTKKEAVAWGEANPAAGEAVVENLLA